VKMAEDDAEASLFFELLGEFNGQDMLAFVLEVLIEVESETKMSLLVSSPGTDPVLLPLPDALGLTSRLFTCIANSFPTNDCEDQSLQPDNFDTLTQKTMDLAVAVERSGESDQVELYVDLFQWIVFVANREYCRESSRRKSLARLLFETGATGTLTSYCPQSADKAEDGNTCKTATCTFPQFQAVVEVLWPDIPRNEIDELYSLSYDFQRGAEKYDGIDGISLEAFLHVADERRFFVNSRR